MLPASRFVKASLVAHLSWCYIGWRFHDLDAQMARKLTDTAHLRLRFDEKLRRRIERDAARNTRSMNAEIIERLEKSFEKEEQRMLMVQAATTALLREGVRIIPFGPPTGEHVEPTPRRPHVTHPVHLRLRFSEVLRRRLEHAAEKNRWPMTAEIIERLEKSFEKQDDQERIDEAASAALRGEGLTS
jgi:plasmid stability protein